MTSALVCLASYLSASDVHVSYVGQTGTSSKSTKLVHGGVRYLQKAVFELDYEQYKLVKEALHERRIFLQTAPYLSQMLPIMLPIYK
jgi:glycerol-3-phosphate dehydrogenase